MKMFYEYSQKIWNYLNSDKVNVGFSHLNYEKQILKEDTSNTETFTQWSAGQNSARYM